MAGIIAAVNNNGTGVSSVAGGTGKGDGVRIMSCQIFSGNAEPTASTVARAAKYAADHGASVLQCSFGVDGGEVRSGNKNYRYRRERFAMAESWFSLPEMKWRPCQAIPAE